MTLVRHKGFAIDIEHPTLWASGGAQIVRDLVEVMTSPRIMLACLQHLIDNRDRLIAGQYEAPDGRGCFMFLLTEPLGDRQICSKQELTRFFGRERGIAGLPGHVPAKQSPEYQPAKWLVRLIDGQICDLARARYGRSCELFDYDLIVAVAEQILVQREALERPVTPQSQLAGS